jgi:hypothetical protein
MADKKISQLTASDALDGTELVPVVQDSVTKRTTTRAIADLGGGGVFSKTFAEIQQLITDSELVTGSLYIMTDFTTIYDQPDFESDGTPKASVVTKTASVEHLVFVATSDSTFAEAVSSIEYPNDKIRFDFTFTQTGLMGAPAKGRIIYREDDKGNILEYDFRKVLFLRYESAPASGVYNQWKDNGGASQEFTTFNPTAYANGTVLYNRITGFGKAYTLIGSVFSIPNIVFQSSGTTIKNNFDIVFNSTFVGQCNENFIGDGGNNITVNTNIYYSYFGHGAVNVVFEDSEENYFGDAIENCTFEQDCKLNSIWDKMTNCTFGDNFQRNIQYGELTNSTIGDGFKDGVIYGLVDNFVAGNNNTKIEIKSSTDITIGSNNNKLKFFGASDIIAGDDNLNIDFGGTVNLTSDNEIDAMMNVAFSGGINGAGWVNYITTSTHPEMYLNLTKSIFIGGNGTDNTQDNVYSRYFDNSTDVITIIN